MTAHVTIRIPAAFRPYTRNQSVESAAAGSVRRILDDLCVQYPDLASRLYKTPGTELNAFLNVYLNDEDIRFLDGLDTPAGAGDEICIISAIAGG